MNKNYDKLSNYQYSQSIKNYQKTITKHENLSHRVHVIIGLLLFGLICSLYGLVFYVDGILPTPFKTDDEDKNPYAFIAERAASNLKYLTDIGPRLVGSYENEVLTVNFLKHEIGVIQQTAHSNQNIEMDLQTNVLVKVYNKNDSKRSLLINAHFDTADTSFGAKDDGIGCAIMLEILRKLSQSSERLKHNIIFLFNGVSVQGSHGFITKHKWAKEVEVFINLEAADVGGKEVVFQTNPSTPWLIKYFVQVPHPNGQVTAEELFQNDLILSEETDFRIFRDFGQLIGFNIAFGRNDYRHHIKFDGFEYIPLGLYQHIGDNILSLIKSLGNAEELEDGESQFNQEVEIYYDIFGLFFISYSHTIAIVIHSIVSVLSILLLFQNICSLRKLAFSSSLTLYVLLTGFMILLGWMVSVIVVLCISYLLDLTKFTMSWYSNPLMIFGLYGIPVLSSCCGTTILFNKFFERNNFYNVSVRAQTQLHLTRIIWTLFLIIGTSCGYRFMYNVLIPLLFQTLTFGIIYIFCIQRSTKIWQVIYFIGMIVPSMFLMKQSIQIIGYLIPITGQIGKDANSELYIGVVTLLLTIIVFSYYVPMITLINKSWIFLTTLSTTFAIFLIIVFTPLSFPYSERSNSPAVERFLVWHIHRIFHNETSIYRNDSGIFISGMDRNSPFTIHKYLNEHIFASLSEDCHKYLHCGLPIDDVHNYDELTWIPFEEPIIHESIKLHLLSRSNMSDSISIFNFIASGPPETNIFILPKSSCNLTSISVLPDSPYPSFVWNDQFVYPIKHVWGKMKTPLTFCLKFKTPPNWRAPVLDIVLTGKYLDFQSNVKTVEYSRLLSQFPDWTDVVPVLAMYESWVY